MDDSKLRRLGTKLLGKKAPDINLALAAVEKLFQLSPGYRDVLVKFGGAIVFENGAKYKADKATPLTKADGYNNLEILFGLGSEKNSITAESRQYGGELPPSFVPIGEGPGGNLLCVDRSGAVFFWDHESARGDPAWQVASSLDQFLEKLEPDDSGIGSTDGIVESESFLDF